MGHIINSLVAFLLVSCLCQVNAQSDERIRYTNVTGKAQWWIAEIQDECGSIIAWEGDKMEIEVSKGITIWFREKLKGNVVIEYDATVVDKGGANDRVSDLNCFWMFSDPKESDGDIKLGNNKRNGLFRNYHTLQGYYVGLGGHDNTRTRYRRYNGDVNRPLKPEHDLTDASYLLVPNKKYHIKLIAQGQSIQYWRDDQLIFNVRDPEPLREGWFALRTLTNHMIIENVTIQSEY